MKTSELLKIINEGGIEHWVACEAMEQIFEWRKWALEIPYIQFPSHWQVKVIPPFGSAVVRFGVKFPNKEGYLSVYLDCYSYLGYCVDNSGEPLPYWEIYPADGGDCARFPMERTDELIKAIEAALNDK